MLGLGSVWLSGTSQVNGLLARLVFGSLALGNGLANVLSSRYATESFASPTRSYHRDARQRVTSGPTIGLGVWLAVWLAPVLALGLSFEPGGLLAGLLVGLVIGTARACSGASFAFLVSALWLAVNRRIPAPWRVMAVLEDRHRLGLLRAIGPVYQFRHAELQDHLSRPAVP